MEISGDILKISKDNKTGKESESLAPLGRGPRRKTGDDPTKEGNLK